MSLHCDGCHDEARALTSARKSGYRRVLWAAFAINAAMFVTEVGGSLVSGSASLLADAVDFAGDAANYGLSLAVLGLPLAWRSRAALVKAASMAMFGAAVLAKTAWATLHGVPPEVITMGAIAVLALGANVAVATLLYAHRDGDANMRSVWLCTRNDVLGNLAVIGAALGVHRTGAAWPDLVVAAIIASLALGAALSVARQAYGELALTRDHH
jgi:Co/Zn/Cd efflux system component